MFGNLVLVGWPVVVKILFDNKTLPIAILASIILGYLLLPHGVGFDLPLMPELNKSNIPVLAALVFILLLGKRHSPVGLAGWMPKGIIPRAFVAMLLGGAFLTVMTNSDPQIFGPTYLPPLRPIDAFSTVLVVCLTILPLLLARKFLAHPDLHRTFLVALALAGAFYSLLALYEVRMSPQLSNMVYGFFPHSWMQHVRGDGFRPIVFLEHGLWVSMFFAMTVLATMGLVRLAQGTTRWLYLALGLWLLMTLVLSKSLGALAIALVLLPVVLVLKPRLQILICAALALVVLLYPALRGGGMIPVDRVMEWAEGISPERAFSFQFRVMNEDGMLERAELRPWFGWGGWGRGFVFDEEGRNLSTADGYWIAIVSVGGWVRYLGEFGLLCVPPILVALSGRRNGYGLETSILAVVLMANIIDLIPNATISPLTWMLAGALWGRLELGRVAAGDATTQSAPHTGHRSREPRYSRATPANGRGAAPRYSRFAPQEKRADGR